MARTFVIGDIHGASRALMQCLERSQFEYGSDNLICLGDVCDGWPDTKVCIEELLKIKNLIYIIGNHDLWALRWMKAGTIPDAWLTQGGAATIASYESSVPETHVRFLEQALPYYILHNKLFVHAGIQLHRPLEQQDLQVFSWDRTLVQKAWNFFTKEITVKLTPFDEVYIGHTPIPFEWPIRSCEIWMMDTGAGWSGVLSLMDVDSKKVFTSDRVPSLYPGVTGRTKAIPNDR
jgi:serine/threonine protein phosphatase 1